MSLWQVIIRSIRFYRWISAAVVAAMAISTAVLVGALVVGDSVKYSLARMVDARLGSVNSVLVGGDKFFTDKIFDNIPEDAAAVLMLNGTAANDEGTKRINKVSVLGVDEKFFRIGNSDTVFDIQDGQAVVNRAVADRLGVREGDEVLVRIGKPSLMPRDIVLVPNSDASTAFRVKVAAVAGEDEFGMFGLSAEQGSAVNVFVSRKWLAEKIGQKNRANVLLATGDKYRMQKTLEQSLSLADAGLKITKGDGFVEVAGDRVFISDAIADALMIEDAGQMCRVFTYFVNEIRCGDKMCPYSMVTGLSISENVPGQLSEKQIMITDWLAADIGAKVGDEIELKYFVPTGSKLAEESSKFTVSKIVEQEKDESYTPKFPGLADEENCRDWQPGIPIDLKKIRDKDEEFWDEYGATPKAFISLEAAQKIWTNRFGKLTSVRYIGHEKSVEQIDKDILAKLKAADAGLNFEDVRQRAEKAGREGTDFGGLFVGLSMFLIAAAVVLMNLVFVFGVERRIEQAGIMAAVGFGHGRIRNVFVAEGAVLAAAGTVIGCAAGLVYTKIMIWCLSTVWAGAIAGSNIHFYASAQTVAMGGGVSFVIAMIAILFGVRKHLKFEVRELLAGFKKRVSKSGSTVRTYVLVFIGAALVAGAIWILNNSGGDKDNAEAFFSAGGMLLLSGIMIAAAVLTGIGARAYGKVNSLCKVAFRNSIRRASRSLAVIIMLAMGSFLVISVGANRKDVTSNANERSSGTGGFALIAESAIPIVEPIEHDGASVVRMRVKDGDDASCLNLNRAQKPTLLGVDQKELYERKAFTFLDHYILEGKSGWQQFDQKEFVYSVPAIGDYATVKWGLGKSLGDLIEYQDQKGNNFKVVIVGIIKDSVLQGRLIISEENFIEKFPSEVGYREFLIDAKPKMTEKISDDLTDEFRDYGFSTQKTVDKLAEFGSVENTYLSIFQVLGGLAMTIGSIGLGLVVMLNVLDRRSELAMMRATGFSKRQIKNMILLEHIGLLAAGLLIGVISAIISVWPALVSAGAAVPYLSLAVTVGAIAVSGIVWISAASAFALRGELNDALRTE